MLRKVKYTFQHYPKQFWILFWGVLFSSTGISLIWPFLTIYMQRKLDVPLTTVASLITLNSFMILASSMVVGPISDRLGRKWIMVGSMILNGISLIMMSFAETLPQFVILMAVRGIFAPLYRIGADAMIADLIDEDNRVEAYSLNRMSNNVGVALGPTLGGFITAASYSAAFFLAAASLIIFGVLAAFFLSETLQKDFSQDETSKEIEEDAGYRKILQDKPFLIFCGSFTLTKMTAALVFVLLSVYTNTNFNIPESQFGFMMATNAIMVVFFQYAVTRFTKQYAPVRLLIVGAFIYGLSVGSIAFATQFSHFILAIIAMTVGELIVAPTATTVVANFAPPNMRGRYMSVYWLTVGASRGIAPVIGGILNDNIAPVAIWYGGLIMGLSGAVGFLLLLRYTNRTKKSISAG